MIRICVCLVVIGLGVVSSLSAQQPPFPTGYAYFTVAVDENVFPNNPSIPRTITATVSYDSGSLVPTSTASHSVDFGDGTVIQGGALTIGQPIEYVHEYTTAGPKDVLLSVPQFNVGIPVQPSIRQGRTLIGSPVPFDPGLSISPTEGFAPLTVTATVQQIPEDVDYLYMISGHPSDWFVFDATDLSKEITYTLAGTYPLQWYATEGTQLWADDHVYLLPPAETMVSVGSLNYLPGIEGVTHLSVSSIGEERCPRLSADGQTLYYLSDADGTSSLYRASRVQGSDDFANPQKITISGTPAPLSPVQLELSDDDLALQLIFTGGLTGQSMFLSRFESQVFGPAQRMVVEREEGIAGDYAEVLDLADSGNRLFGYAGGYPAIHQYDPSRPFRYVATGTGFAADLIPRLSASSASARVWDSYGAYAAWGIDLDQSVYELYDYEFVQASFRWHALDAEFQTDPFNPYILGELSEDGGLLILAAARNDSIGNHDLYAVRLSPPEAVFRSRNSIARYIVESESESSAESMNENKDGQVDTADVQSIGVP